MSDGELQRLIAEVIGHHFREWPVKASFMGYGEPGAARDGADSADAWRQLGFFSVDARTTRERRNFEHFARLKRYRLEHPEMESHWDDSIDWELAASLLEFDTFLETELVPAERDPTLYPKTVLFGLYWLLLADYPEPAMRGRDLLARLKQVPRVFDEGEANLSTEPAHVPALWVEMAIEICDAGREFVTTEVPRVFDELAEWRPASVEALDDAVAAFGAFSAFLVERLQPAAHGSTAIGEPAFNRTLAGKHFLDLTAAQVEAAGLEGIEQAKAQLREVARQLMPGEPLDRVLAHMQADMLAPEDDIAAKYRARVEDARAFCVERGLVTIPEGERCTVMETPPFARATTTYAAYQQPPAFGARAEGSFWVTPPQPGKPTPHVRAGVDLVAVHEAYPGHHVQFVRTNTVSRPIRKLFKTSVFVEGWGLYCEELMYRNEFFASPWTRLYQLTQWLWRAVRAVVDARLATGAMTPEQAARMLADHVKLPLAAARKEVRRYTLYPTQPMSYLIGKRQIDGLVVKLRAANGARFSPRRFHDAFLSFGTIPIDIIEQALTSQPELTREPS